MTDKSEIVKVNNVEFRCFVNQFGEAWLDQRDQDYVKKSVYPYLKANVEDHVDWQTLEVNNTHLAEDAAQHFNIYVGDNYSIPTQLYDWAIEVGLDWERDHQVD